MGAQYTGCSGHGGFPSKCFILTFNAGSSSLRFAVFDADCVRSPEGKFERMGGPEARLILNGAESSRTLALMTHADCLLVICELLEENGTGTAGDYQPPAWSHGAAGSTSRYDARDGGVAGGIAGDQIICPKPPAGGDHAHGSGGSRAGRRPRRSRALTPLSTAICRWRPGCCLLPRRYAAQGIRRYGFHGLAFSSVLAELQHRTGGRIPSRLIPGPSGPRLQPCGAAQRSLRRHHHGLHARQRVGDEHPHG